ncbi:MAG: acyltransferase [Actinomycetia bacterium]|nr:acyltransferase [Actinomycetes bacterium]
MAGRGKSHVAAIDLVRTLTILGVVSVHSTWFTNDSQNFSANAVMDVLHFTREVFLFMTAFVLFYNYYDRPLDLRRFWPRRFKLVAFPYVIWSIFYLVYGGALRQGLGPFLATLGHALLTGTAWFHLYYLLVTMQIYLAFPLLLWLVRRTEGHHRTLLVVAGVFDLVLFGVYQYWAGPLAAWLPGWLRWVVSLRGQVFFTYEFFLVLGALAAVHYRAVAAWVAAHGRLVALLFVGSLVAMWAAFAVGVLVFHQSVAFASGVLQPLMVPYAAAVIGGLFWLGLKWAERRARWPRGSALVSLVADLSFGIYLVHPWFLQQIATYLVPQVGALTRLVVTPATVLLTFAVATLAVRLIAATPLSVYLIGRETLPWPARVRHDDARPAPMRGQASYGSR